MWKLSFVNDELIPAAARSLTLSSTLSDADTMATAYVNQSIATNALATKLELFEPLSREQRAKLDGLTSGRQRFVGAREDVIREGEEPSHVYLIVSGWAYRYKVLENGHRQILSFLLPGDLCDLRIFILKRMDHSIGTLVPTVCAEISKEAIIEVTEGHSNIARALWWSSLVAEAIEREWIVNLGSRASLQRIGHLFCEIYLRQEAIGLCFDQTCDMPLTQNELAEACGMSAVHVNRSLQELRASGLVELQRRRLTIRDFQRLARESMFSSNYLHLGHRDDERCTETSLRHGRVFPPREVDARL